MNNSTHAAQEHIKEHIAAGRPREALALLQTQVRSAPADVKLRIFLFQLLCVMGQWSRAATQLEVCGELDAATLSMVNTYREALKCELVREAVFAGKTTPMVLGEPQAWVAWLVEALQADARGDRASAARLRSEALSMAPTQGGTLNGNPFDWIADADSRLGPMLEAVVNGRYCWVPFAALSKVHMEAPEDLRDFVWAPAQLEFPNGGNSVALIPTRYCSTLEAATGLELMARSTEWDALGGTDHGADHGADHSAVHYAGRGQRLLTTSTLELGVLELRELVMTDPVDSSKSA
jgi:type VI secretion system protein ImpE